MYFCVVGVCLQDKFLKGLLAVSGVNVSVVYGLIFLRRYLRFYFPPSMVCTSLPQPRQDSVLLGFQFCGLSVDESCEPSLMKGLSLFFCLQK